MSCNHLFYYQLGVGGIPVSSPSPVPRFAMTWILQYHHYHDKCCTIKQCTLLWLLQHAGRGLCTSTPTTVKITFNFFDSLFCSNVAPSLYLLSSLLDHCCCLSVDGNITSKAPQFLSLHLLPPSTYEKTQRINFIFDIDVLYCTTTLH